MGNPKEQLKQILLAVIDVCRSVTASTGVSLSSGEIVRMAITFYIQAQKDGTVFADDPVEKDEVPEPVVKELPKGNSKGGNGFDKESVVIPFGKYKGKTIISVLQKGDRGYLVWLKDSCKIARVKEATALLLDETDSHDIVDHAN